jgi:hypothetical protein
MADNKSNKGQSDRAKVSGDEDYELSFLEEKLGVTRQQVKDAIKAVGNNRSDVEEYLRKGKKSS